MEAKSTRLRNVRSKDLDLLSDWVINLPFKVELKSLVWNGKQFCQTYVTPDNAPLDFPNLNLDEIG